MVLKAIRSTMKFTEGVSLSAATQLTRLMTFIPHATRINTEQRHALAHATKLTFKRSGEKVAWSWGRGPLVILVHAWEGSGADFAIMAQQLADQGFRAVALDVTGHGESSGRLVSFKDFCLDIAALCEFLEVEEPHGFIAHDEAGLCLMAGREQYGLTAEHYVLIGSRNIPHSRLAQVQRRWKVSDRVLNNLRESVAKELGCTWKEMQKCCVLNYQDHGELLLVHDKRQTHIAHMPVAQILGAWRGRAYQHKAHSGKPRRLLADARVITEISDFLHDFKRVNEAC